MAWPEHQNPRTDDRTACAPYNFVPLPEKVVSAVESADDLPSHNSFADSNFPHTGYFEVTLETKSPLYIRCPFSLQRFLQQERRQDGSLFHHQVKNTPEFFHRGNPEQPVIPGSSLRGMLRSLVEIVGYGKMAFVTDRNLIYRAVGDRTSLGAWYREQMLGPNRSTSDDMDFDYPSPQLKGGYLRRQGTAWCIQSAHEHCGESIIHVEYDEAWPVIGQGRSTEGEQRIHHVYVKPAPRKTSKRPEKRGGRWLSLNLAEVSAGSIAKRDNTTSAPPGMVEAVLVESGHMGKPRWEHRRPHQKHMHCVIYAENPHKTPIPIPTEMWRDYEEDRDMTRDMNRKPRRLREGEPLFYLLDRNGKLIFFGHTMMFRLPYRNSIHDMIPAEVKAPLQIDIAEALFGFIRQKGDFQGELPEQGSKARGYGGRLSVTDATLISPVPQDLWESEQPITPPILSTPKPTSFQNYLVQPKNAGVEISHYDSPTRDADGTERGARTVIRGHKLYWHQGEKQTETLREPNSVHREDKQHTQFKPLRGPKNGKPGIKFQFRVYFENLSESELGAVCWALQPRGKEGTSYYHKLGMGKALGMGAVHLNSTLHVTPRVPQSLSKGAERPGPASRYEKLFDNVDNWHTAEQRVSLEGYRERFEKHIWNLLKPEEDFRNLQALPRIEMLLEMMGWPGPDAKHVRTMGLSEFKDRRVLPGPLYVASNGKGAKLRAPHAPNSTNVDRSQGRDLPPARQRPEQHRNPPPQRQATVLPPARRETRSEWVTLLTKANRNREASVRTDDGQVIKCRFVPPDLNAESEGKAKVTRQNGKVVEAQWGK